MPLPALSSPRTCSGPPDLRVQQDWDAAGDFPRFHLLVTGEGCLTEFLLRPTRLDGLPDEPTSDLYKILTRAIETGLGVNNISVQIGDSLRWVPLSSANPGEVRGFVPSCTAVEWGWWDLHQGVLATKREFRFLIRVTESNYHEPLPESRLADILRTQQMVYTPAEFGW